MLGERPHDLMLNNSNKTPVGVNAGGKPTVKTSFIPLVLLADRKIA